MLDLADYRQLHDYDCGASVTRSVARYFGVGPLANDDYIEALGTDKLDGTRPDRIVQYLRSLGLMAVGIERMDIGSLRAAIFSAPVICAIQAEEDGHYVVAIGMDRSLIYLQDPWRGRVTMPIEQFNLDWHDAGVGAVRYVRLGIVVCPGAKS